MELINEELDINICDLTHAIDSLRIIDEMSIWLYKLKKEHRILSYKMRETKRLLDAIDVLLEYEDILP